VPPSQKPYKEAREDVGRKVYDVKLKALVDDWVGKLRDLAEVKIYLSSPSPSGEKTGKH